jgi:seryl-tRNA synthetase
MLALKIAVFLLTLSLGIVSATLRKPDVQEERFSVPAVLDPSEARSAPDMMLNSPEAPPPRPLDCVDAVRDPETRAKRLKEIDRLRREVDKLSREIKKNNPLKRDIEILDETIRIQKQINELEKDSDSRYQKSLYREICYQ